MVGILQIANYTKTDIIRGMKPLQFLGDSLKCLREFPKDASKNAGYELDRVQNGLQPTNFRPMPTIGRGVEEIKVWDESGQYRVIYTARKAEAIYVLHAFQKKTQQTSQGDIDIAKQRFAQLVRGEV